MIAVVGEVLVDCFPEYERVGGAPFNFACHLQRLGFAIRFISRIGDDRPGRRIRRLLDRRGFDADGLQVDAARPTGRVSVTLDGEGVPAFDILEDAAWDRIEPPGEGDGGPEAIQLVYFGTLAMRTAAGEARIRRFLERTGAAATRFCDLNLRPPHVNPRAVATCLRQADILKLNTEELARLAAMLDGPADEEPAAAWLSGAHGIGTVALTRGAGGSTLWHGGLRLDAPPARVGRVVDTVGAGDAFAAVLAAGRLAGTPDARTLELAAGFAARICGTAGATPEDDGIYNRLRTALEGEIP